MPASYFTLERGTPVTDRFGQPVGRIKKVLVAEGGHFDGVIVTTRAGDRFVDAPEVRRITHGIRRDRLLATDDDRSVAITQLKIAFVESRLTVEELERRVESAHRASQLRELDKLLVDIG